MQETTFSILKTLTNSIGSIMAMMCYKDMTFCSRYASGDCINHNCYRAFTGTQKENARKWLGGEKFTVTFSDLRNEICGEIPNGR